MAKHKIILDTDPGVDDILAILFALAHQDIDLLAITTVHGNVDSTQTTRNVISLFDVINADASLPWMSRVLDGRTILARGASQPLNAELAVDAAYFHGRDGLGGVSDTYPQFVPGDDWQTVFQDIAAIEGQSDFKLPRGLIADKRPAHSVILDILSSHDPDTVSVVAVGPLTNIALAMSADPSGSIFSRCRELISMGGAIGVPGNVTPLSEFNFMADPEACALVFSRTSHNPDSTAEPGTPALRRHTSASAAAAVKPVKLTLLPLDTTTKVLLHQPDWQRYTSNATGGGGSMEGGAGTLARWCSHFIDRTFDTMRSLYTGVSVEQVGLSMHDPACIWYLLNRPTNPTLSGGAVVAGGGEGGVVDLGNGWEVTTGVDIRMECQGRWSRGSCIVDRRGRQRLVEAEINTHGGDVDRAVVVERKKAGDDHVSWLKQGHGNAVDYVSATPGGKAFVADFMPLVFGEASSV